MAVLENGSSSYEAGSNISPEPLAIIGIACRFAGDATDPRSLWKFLLDGQCAAGHLPTERFNAIGYYHPDPEHGGTTATTRGYFLKDNIDAFDVPFFQLAESDVLAMDPQQKLLLENVYHALENAGLSIQDVASSLTSVFVGCSNNDHLALANDDLEIRLKNKATATSPSILANRVSWFYDLRGTSQTLDTACSSSLVAFHQGCLTIQSGEADMSIISGVNVIEHPAAFLQLTSLGVLSPDGQCFSFDHRANGYGRGEGVSTVIIKPLRSAIRDGNSIRAIVRATGTNHDGKTSGITLPSQEAQAALIRRVYARTNLDMNQTAYVEAHGTGTLVGDPLEVKAIVSAFDTKSRREPLYIGSIKAGLGHLEGGAGLAGLVKAVLMLERRTIPPTVNLEKVNPQIPTNSNIEFARSPITWPCTGVRRISVNSFGFGGTNAHVVLDDADSVQSPMYTRPFCPNGNGEQAPQLLEKVPDINFGIGNHCADNGIISSTVKSNEAMVRKQRTRAFVLSSLDEKGLQRAAERLHAHLKSLETFGDESSEIQYLEDLAFTLSEKRPAQRWRSFFVASSMDELNTRLTMKMQSTFRYSVNEQRIGFVFTGQGAQWLGMGFNLMIYPIFRKSIEDASAYMENLGSPWILKDVFDGHSEGVDIHHPLLSQSGCTALQIALVELMASWNIIPHVAVGHSSGEVAAAYCAKGISREAAWKIGYCRGQVCAKQHHTNRGAMIAVGSSREAIDGYLKNLGEEKSRDVQIGCFNSPKNFTVTGPRRNILSLQAMLDEDGVFSRLLPVQVAYHSIDMNEVADEYRSLLGDLSFGTKLEIPRVVKLVSSLEGSPIHPEETEAADYWVRHMVYPVQFINSLLATCLDSDQYGATIHDLIELGPHSALRSAIKEILAPFPQLKNIRYAHCITRHQISNTQIVDMATALYCRGYSVNMRSVNFPQTTSSFAPTTMLKDLPPYPFNHEKIYRIDSRIISNVRNRPHPRHELLGSPIIDWDETEPTWRNFLRTAEMAWLRQNKMKGKIIYPGVAYLLTAVEAVKQLADPTREISGFRLRNVSLMAALIIPDTVEGIEIKFGLRNTNHGPSRFQTWLFSMKSYDTATNRWTEHCTGSVSVEYLLVEGPIDSVRQPAICSVLHLESASERCSEEFDVDKFYRKLDLSEINFGPVMRNLRSIKLSKSSRECVGLVTVPNMADLPSGYFQPYILHPTVMESVTHILLLICASNPESIGKEMLTTFMEEIWFSPNIKNEPGRSFQTVGSAKRKSRTSWMSDVRVWDDEMKNEQIAIKGIQLLEVTTESEGEVERCPCYSISWHLSTDLPLTATSFQATTQGNGSIENLLKFHENHQLASALMILRALDDLKNLNIENMNPHHKQMYNWMQHEASKIEKGMDIFLNVDRLERLKKDENLRSELYHNVKNANARGELLVRIGENIIPIFMKEKDPLEIMFGEGDLMPRTYDEGFTGNILPSLTKYLETLAFNHPNLNILEVGAGTGSATRHILEILQSSMAHGIPAINRYHFTDLSGGFLERARKRFCSWSTLMDYGILNIENEPLNQGFLPGSYDVVVATHVLHATTDLQKTLTNVRSLLKPGGKLILIENTEPDLRCTPFTFSVLPGWWMSSEPDRAFNPLIREDRWIEFLGKGGFASTDLIFRDTEASSVHEVSVIVATAMSSDSETGVNDIQSHVAICGSNAQTNSELVLSLKQKFRHRSVNLQICNYRDLVDVDLRNTLALVLLDLDSFDMSTLTESEYKNVNHLLSTCSALVWVSGDELANPKISMSTGIIRTIRWERDLENINFLTLKVRNPVPSADLLSDKIMELYYYNFEGRFGLEKNGEFIFRDGSFWANRLLHQKDVDHFLDNQLSQAAYLQPLGRGIECPLKGRIRRPRMLASLEFIEDESLLQPMNPTEVTIEIRACGLSFYDIIAISGESQGDGLGGESSGLVIEVGEAVTHLKAGDRVMAINMSRHIGSLRSIFRTQVDFVQKIPDGVDFTEAAAMPVIFCTAYHALHNLARIRSGESVLIHSAAGGIGQAAIQFSTIVGADIFATVSTIEQKASLITKYGLKEDHIFFSSDLSFEKGIMMATNCRGIDVVLNAFRGEVLQATWRCLASFGRFIDLRSKYALGLEEPDIRPLSRNSIYARIDISSTGYAEPSVVSEIFEKVAQLYRKNTICSPSPLIIFNYAELAKALSQLQSDDTTGKIVLVPHEEDLVLRKPPPMTPYYFRSDSSYILAGGLGGLGRSIATWMASRGAKNFIFVSRSGARTDVTKAFVKELTSNDCQVRVIAADLSDREQLFPVLQACMAAMPAVKGCFQCSMVLQDSLFVNMTYSQFYAAVMPKVQGSLNLIELLPKSIDFIICLSSAAAIAGNRGQANYVAANSFQDSLAEHLVSKGIPGLSVNLGSVLSVGWVAENQQKLPISVAFGTLSEAELLSIIEYHIDPKWKATTSVETCHTLAGLRSAAYFSQRGLPPPAFMHSPFFSHLRTPSNPRNSKTEKEDEFAINDLLKAGNSLEIAADAISKAIAWKLSRVMSIPTEDIDLSRSLTSYGVDSLVIVDFRTWITKEMGATVRSSDILSEKSILQLGFEIATLSNLVSKE